MREGHLMAYNAIDLFCGCGGLTQGLKDAGFRVLVGIELSAAAAAVYRANHPNVNLLEQDINTLNTADVKAACDGQEVHLIAGCPPCQGFSSIRRRNRRNPVDDPRNDLTQEHLRFVTAFMPYAFMLENVPAIETYPPFADILRALDGLGYEMDCRVVNVADYGVPQRRKRYVMIGSRIGRIEIPEGKDTVRTVRDVIGHMETPEQSQDHAHRIVAHHTPRIQNMIKLVPHDGGSRTDLPAEYVLACHKKERVGFKDVYGRLKWDDVSSTITGGCLNPSKGRFLHPDQDRAITAREAALLQTFPRNYVFPPQISKTQVSLMIGNALPPKFALSQAKHIYTEFEQKEVLGS